jgi:hypothetical protein
LPAVQVAIAVPQRAGLILGELGVAVSHEANSERSGGGAGKIDSQAAAGAKASRLTSVRPLTTVWESLTTPAKSDEALFFHLIPAEQVRVVTEISQKPAQLPESLRSAVESSGEGAPDQGVGLEHGESNGVGSPLPFTGWGGSFRTFGSG